MNKLIALCCGIAAAGIAGPETLTLEQALELARANSPELRAARAEALAAGEDLRAAGRWANPELGFEAEGLGGDNAGGDRSEYTLGIAQEFPTSGKISKSRAVARHGQLAANSSMAWAERKFEVAVRSAFAEVLARQEIARVRSGQEKLAQEFVDTAAARHAAGGASELETTQAEIQLEAVRLETLRSENELGAARAVLALLLGIDLPSLGTPAGDFFQPLETTATWAVLDSHPLLKRFQSLEEQQRAEARLARSQGIPDVSLGAGVRYEEDGDIQSYMLGASMPLPFFKTGRPESAAATLRADAVGAEREVARRQLRQDLARTLVEYQTAVAAAKRYRETLLPKATKLHGLSQAGYESGRYSSLDLIVAQKNLAAINIHYIEALRDARIAQAELTQYIPGE